MSVTVEYGGKVRRQGAKDVSMHRDIGTLLDLGLSLGYQRFEVVQLADGNDGVAAHAWADDRVGTKAPRFHVSPTHSQLDSSTKLQEEVTSNTHSCCRLELVE